MKQITRRSFLKGSLFGAAALSLPARSWASVPGANETIRMAVVGFNGQGGSHINSILGLQKGGEKVRIVALCDVDSDVLKRGQNSLGERGEKVETYVDIRKLLENKEIDALSIATPNHWHALGTIWACQAGKDVYVEKPVSHNVWEGRQMVLAARKYKRIVQTGTQSRSSQGIKEAIAWVRAGNLGKIKVGRGFCYKPRQSIGKVSAPQPIPTSVDYDLWCGPSPKNDLRRARLHYDWHWVWATGSGDLGNQGIHQMDIARWFLGEPALSPAVFSMGGRLGYVDDGETPNTQIVFHDYPAAPLIFEVRGLPSAKEFHTDGKKWSSNMDKYKGIPGASVAVVIECENGYVLVPNYNSAIAFDTAGKEVKRFSGATNHHGNFLNAVRTRKETDLNADILEGHLSSGLCHTGNVSYLLGKKESPDVIREKIKGEPDAVESFGRMAEHLGANGVDLNSDKVTLGAFLKMDAKKERFTGKNSKEANPLLTREYRAPFIVPAKV